MLTKFSIIRPDDWHLHVRDGAMMGDVIRDTVRSFSRAIIMPNLKPPVTTTELALAYRQRIIDVLPESSKFEPLMALYLTDNTQPAEVEKAKSMGMIGIKYYPAGATTNSDSGVTDIAKCHDVLETMSQCGMPLLIHGEVTNPLVDVFDREQVFIQQVLIPILEKFPSLRVVLEHITTRQAVNFVKAAPSNVAATITVHHLLYNRNAMFAGGIRPHFYCLPVLKREDHRWALIGAATSGNPKFFLGTDSAPHGKQAKEAACGCAGIYTAHGALELYAEVFEKANALDKLEGFASFYGADFYGLPRNVDTITLEKQSWEVPETLPFGNETLVPLRAGESIQWKIL